MIRLSAAASLTLLATGAFAQTGQNYDVKTMNFDMWCQEQAHLPADRCDKRSAEDEKTFEDYRSKIERYEVPYLQQQQRDLAVRPRHHAQRSGGQSGGPGPPGANPGSQPPDADAARLKSFRGRSDAEARLRRCALARVPEAIEHFRAGNRRSPNAERLG